MAKITVITLAIGNGRIIGVSDGYTQLQLENLDSKTDDTKDKIPAAAALAEALFGKAACGDCDCDKDDKDGGADSGDSDSSDATPEANSGDDKSDCDKDGAPAQEDDVDTDDISVEDELVAVPHDHDDAKTTFDDLTDAQVKDLLLVDDDIVCIFSKSGNKVVRKFSHIDDDGVVNCFLKDGSFLSNDGTTDWPKYELSDNMKIVVVDRYNGVSTKNDDAQPATESAARPCVDYLDNLQSGDALVVEYSKSGNKTTRYFSHLDNGVPHCFLRGLKSGATTDWPKFEIPADTKAVIDARLNG